MHSFLTPILTILLHFGTGDPLRSIDCEQELFETAFDRNVHVEASVSYPRVPETTPLVCYVNEAVSKEAHELQDTFVQEMSAPQEELWEENAANQTIQTLLKYRSRGQQVVQVVHVHNPKNGD